MTDKDDTYPRCLGKEFIPFDPLDLAKRTEEIVCEGDRRKYTKFSCQRFYGGITTGYTCGCNLRCIFCWVSWSRDFPERHGTLYSPKEVFQNLSKAARKKNVRQVRISGGESLIGRDHLLGLLERIEHSSFRVFILETNGILLGAEPDYVRELARFKKVHARIAIKAGTSEAYTRRTGATPESFGLPFKAIEHLLEADMSFHVAAMTGDPRIVTWDERNLLFQRLREIHPATLHHLEEEVVSPYHNAKERLQRAGMNLNWEE
ncbi:MAG: radical SAM protein [Planctomycetota bacterium]|jgi:uncharacterized Fe-S cluster-containing radical SAM superfamily protein